MLITVHIAFQCGRLTPNQLYLRLAKQKEQIPVWLPSNLSLGPEIKASNHVFATLVFISVQYL